MRLLVPAVREVAPDELFDLYDVDTAWQHVRAGMVMSADGSTAFDRSSRPLSSPPDMAVFRTLRGVADVVLVGAETARREGYGRIPLRQSARAWRLEHGRAPEVRLAVVSRVLELSDQLLATNPIVVTCEASPGDVRGRLAQRTDVVVAGDDDVRIDVALDALAERGLCRVLCEGGPKLLTAVVAARRLDELCLTVSPVLAGGLPMLTGPLSTLQPLRLVSLLEEDGVLLARYASP